MNPLSEMDEKELHDIVEESRKAEKFLHSGHWKFLLKLGNRISERVDRELAFNANPADIGKMWEIKITKKFFKYQLKTEFEMIIQDGNDALDELEERKKYGNLEPQAGSEQDS